MHHAQAPWALHGPTSGLRSTLHTRTSAAQYTCSGADGGSVSLSFWPLCCWLFYNSEPSTTFSNFWRERCPPHFLPFRLCLNGRFLTTYPPHETIPRRFLANKSIPPAPRSRITVSIANEDILSSFIAPLVMKQRAHSSHCERTCYNNVAVS